MLLRHAMICCCHAAARCRLRAYAIISFFMLFFADYATTRAMMLPPLRCHCFFAIRHIAAIFARLPPAAFFAVAITPLLLTLLIDITLPLYYVCLLLAFRLMSLLRHCCHADTPAAMLFDATLALCRHYAAAYEHMPCRLLAATSPCCLFFRCYA